MGSGRGLVDTRAWATGIMDVALTGNAAVLDLSVAKVADGLLVGEGPERHAGAAERVPEAWRGKLRVCRQEDEVEVDPGQGRDRWVGRRDRVVADMGASGVSGSRAHAVSTSTK